VLGFQACLRPPLLPFCAWYLSALPLVVRSEHIALAGEAVLTLPVRNSVLGRTPKEDPASLKCLLCAILPHAVPAGLKTDQFRIRKAGKKQVFFCKLYTTPEPKSHITATVYCNQPIVGQYRASLLDCPWEFSCFLSALVVLFFHTCHSSIAFLTPPEIGFASGLQFGISHSFDPCRNGAVTQFAPFAVLLCQRAEPLLTKTSHHSSACVLPRAWCHMPL